MGFSRFIWKNALRNKRRTGLTVLSIAFSLFLLMVLLTVMGVLLNPVTQDEAALRLIVSRSTSLADLMPMSYQEKIRRVPNVTHVAPLQYFNGIYKDPNYVFPNFATDPKEIWDIYTEQIISPEQKAAFIADRQGAAATYELAKRFGWKLGDRITLLGTYFPIDLELNIVAFFKEPIGQEMLYFRYDYMNEAMEDFGQVGAFVVRGTDTASIAGISDAIDSMFRNSPAETKTDTEKAFVLGFVSMLGNIQLIIASVAGVVVFTMLLVAVSTMAMTIRERLREVAILKTIGYRRPMILALIMGEALFISLVGAAIGIGLAESLRLVDLTRMTQGFLTRFDPVFSTYAAVVGAGLAIGLISGFFPAWQAVNLTINAAMRRLD